MTVDCGFITPKPDIEISKIGMKNFTKKLVYQNWSKTFMTPNRENTESLYNNFLIAI
jgi:hypothetical protein